MDMLSILIAPFIASILLAGILCYLGLHIVSRGVIFADLSLAQMAALGATVAIIMGYEADSTITYFVSLGFAFIGAIIFVLGKFKKEKVPQEAIIGIVYGVSSALAILFLQKAPHGAEELERILVGSILFVSWQEILRLFILFSIIGLVHFLFRKQFLALTFSDKFEGKEKFWDFMFFITFAIVVTSAVKIAGILLIFSYLVIPAVAAMFFFNKTGKRLLFGWIFGIVGSLIGIWFSATYDFPTGASIIVVLGVLLIAVISLKKTILR